MKSILFAVFENESDIDPLLFSLHERGFNGTFLPASSFNSLANASLEESPVLSLSEALGHKKVDNPAFFLVLDEKDFPTIKSAIEEYTDSFKRIKGGIFVWPLSYFEGSFK